jgi:hypothetical protein
LSDKSASNTDGGAVGRSREVFDQGWAMGAQSIFRLRKRSGAWVQDGLAASFIGFSCKVSEGGILTWTL